MIRCTVDEGHQWTVSWVVSLHTQVPGGQLSSSDGKNHDDAKYDDDDQVDGQHDLLETMTLHTDTQTYVQVTTLSGVYYATVTSIVHDRLCCNVLVS